MHSCERTEEVLQEKVFSVALITGSIIFNLDYSILLPITTFGIQPQTAELH